ncbi:hypothetical protein HBI70_121880 [Parastagonospora nodorum]|nr:hypothetical protein HBI10_100240 [Parastagonospora nodorum]KAH4026682.1 hypothetical protein HBI13_065370 [Parastagonospora nodorum]KAH4411503.1 hypothetical protein HBH92_114570 [Parastagonospora nodorum]KAH4424070.1 hypothetical protein HBH93_191670 [Parastagonospora nodorum]KAH4443390.1 hypothetical protein HBH91_156630 [Parastagonospora nodorum]
MPYISRSLYSLRSRLAFVLLVTAFCHQQHLFFVSRQSLAAKYSATEFEVARPELHPRFERPDDEDAEFQDDLIANRDDWTVLGEGWEGKVFAYKDSVIKTFTPGRSPFRNCASGATNERWPTEIAASLRFGGFDQEVNNGDAGNTTFEGFLPVRAYFKAALSPAEDPEWHLVTPLVEDGNLKDLAKRLSREVEDNSVREIDAHYRPAFERLLQNLQTLHEARYCHDDIKPANIFIQEDTNWLLGDLGNVRHISHAYHSSRLWQDNNQLKDCRANDIMRALKSYLQFIRAASPNQQQFDVDFLERREPLSRLFWTASAGAPKMSAAKLQHLSAVEYPHRAPVPQSDEQTSEILKLFRHWSLRKAVDHALETRIGEKLARWWGIVSIFGVPENKTCGF